MNQKIDIQAYILSGILEQYALGITTAEQNEEIAVLLKQYPELQKELMDIEKSLEVFAQQYAKPMPAYLKERVLRNIEQEKSLLKTSADSINKNLKYVLFLSLPILLFSTLYFWNSNQKAFDQSIELKKQTEELKLKLKQDSIALLDCNSQLNVLRNKNQQRILLKGTTNSPQSFAAVFYDTLEQKTYLDVLELPSIPAHKQYQLWAIVSGKPVDLGVFDLIQNTAFKEIKFIPQAEAFAITLEAYGGVESPSLDQMYVLGALEKRL